MSKRSASAPKSPAKKARVSVGARADGTSKKVRVVKAAIEKADLPEDVMEMLGGMLHCSLGVTQDTRHGFQKEIVVMVGNAISGIEAAMRKSVADGEAEASGFETEKAKRDAAVEAAVASLKVKTDELQGKKKTLANDCLFFRSKRATLEEAEAARKAGDAELVAAAKKREKLQAVIDGDFKPLKDGAEGHHTPEKVTGALQKEIELDQSLVTASCSALGKAPDTRGPFDAMAITELEERINKCLADFDTQVRNGEPSKATRAAAVEAAKGVFEEAKAKQKGSARSFTETQNEETARQEFVTAAHKSVTDFVKETRKSTTALAQAKTKLDKFLEGPMAVFAELRDHVTPVPEPEVVFCEAPEEAPAAPAEDAPMVAEA